MTCCCCTKDEEDQAVGCILCHYQCGCCPMLCCKYDYDGMCWGFVCCKCQVDPCWLPRTFLNIICLPFIPCCGYQCKDVLEWALCCNPGPETKVRLQESKNGGGDNANANKTSK